MLHFLKKEKIDSLTCWTEFSGARLLPKSASEMTLLCVMAMQRGFINLQT